jgi:F0F1-type ATP synthase assembly protein I
MGWGVSMGVSLSTDFILGLLVGAVITLLFQQVTRSTNGMGKWLPIILVGFVVCAGIIYLTWGR